MLSAASVAADLQEGLTGRATVDPIEIAAFAGNISHLTCCIPMVAVLPTCEADVVHALRVAATHGLRVTVRGAGHSGHLWNVSDGGLLLVNRSEEAEWRWVDDDRIEVTG